jgi:hypothetical protein
MTYPVAPTIATSYTAFQQAQGDNSFPGAQLDADLRNLRDAITAVNNALKLIQRSDGEVANGTIGNEQLAAGLVLGIEPPTGWITGTVYAYAATVFAENGYYVCMTGHTAGDFSSDLSAGYWLLLINFEPYIQESVDDAIGDTIDEAAGDAVDASIAASNLVPQTASTTALIGTAATANRGVRLTDSIRDATFLWDAAITPAEYALDPEGLVYVVPVDGENGAWVNPLADRRRGLWTDSAIPGRRLRVTSGLFAGKNAVTYLGATEGNNGDSEFWVHDDDDDHWWVANAGNLLERDGGSINTAIVSRGPVTGSGYTVGLLIGTVGRNTGVGANTSHCVYFESVASATHASNAGVGEFEIINQRGASSVSDGEKPYIAATSLTYLLGLGAGGGRGVNAGDNVDHLFRVVGNGAKFKAGITFKNGALVADGNTEHRAMQLYTGNSFVWYRSGDTESARIVCNSTTGDMWRMAFGDSLFAISRGGDLGIVFEPVADATRYLKITSAAGTDPVKVEAVGGNADLMLKPAGSGVVRFGNTRQAASNAANFTATGYLEIKDSSGTSYYVPARGATW